MQGCYWLRMYYVDMRQTLDPCVAPLRLPRLRFQLASGVPRLRSRSGELVKAFDRQGNLDKSTK